MLSLSDYDTNAANVGCETMPAVLNLSDPQNEWRVQRMAAHCAQQLCDMIAFLAERA
jgi:hypothetical protein